MNDLSEKEQLDELRAWWKENRFLIIGGIALGIAIIAGFKLWNAQQLNSSLAASGHYEELLDQVSKQRLEPAREIADKLIQEHSSTIYADQARLAMARLYMDNGRDADAAEILRPLATGSGDKPMQLVARLRLASILLYQDKPQEVLDLLKLPRDSAFAARFNEVIGDAHVALGNIDEAAAAYNAVLADARGAQTVDSGLVQMKLGDLPDTSELAASDGAAAATEEQE